MAIATSQARMVEYTASACPHCQDMQPAWGDATNRWEAHGQPEADKLVWQKKECLDQWWEPGKDYAECRAQKIRGFPTIKFFANGSDNGVEFLRAPTAENLLSFAKRGIDTGGVSDFDDAQNGTSAEQGLAVANPRLADVHDNAGLGYAASQGGATANGGAAAKGGGGARFIEYFAASCPHCQKLAPVWTDAEKRWYTPADGEPGAPPKVSWIRKECYGEDWSPGKDLKECQAADVHSFPSMKFMPADPHVQPSEYHGERTPEAIINFLKKQAGVGASSGGAAAGVAPHGHAGGAAPEREATAAPTQVDLARAPAVQRSVGEHVVDASNADAQHKQAEGADTWALRKDDDEETVELNEDEHQESVGLPVYSDRAQERDDGGLLDHSDKQHDGEPLGFSQERLKRLQAKLAAAQQEPEWKNLEAKHGVRQQASLLPVLSCLPQPRKFRGRSDRPLLVPPPSTASAFV